MVVFNEIVLMLHFLGLAVGFSVSIANFVMLGIITKAAPAEKPVLERFLPVMSRVGRYGLALLWATGIFMVYTRWNGFAGMPWEFHVKLTAVIILTLVVLYIAKLERMISRGDRAAADRIPTMGKIASVCALAAVIFAVVTFN